MRGVVRGLSVRGVLLPAAAPVGLLPPARGERGDAADRWYGEATSYLIIPLT